MTKQIAIVTVVRDDYKGLLKTIKSVISQTIPKTDIEHIIIDAGAQAREVESIAKIIDNNAYITYLAESDDGIYYAMNKSANYITSKWVLFLNTGDILYSKDVLENLYKYVHTQDVTDEIIVGKWAESWKGQQIIHNVISHTKLPIYMPSSHQAILIQKQVFCKYLFDTSFVICADAHQLSRLFVHGLSFAYCDICISCVNAEGFSTKNFSLMMKEKIRIQKELFPSIRFMFKMRFYVIKEYIKKYIKMGMPFFIVKKMREKKYK